MTLLVRFKMRLYVW